MNKDWRNVKEEIEQELDKIWWDEPEEVRKSRLGIFPSGAGTDNQVLGNLFFLVCDTQAMGWWTVEPGMLAALDDPEFTVEHCKNMWKYLTVHMADLMGETALPNCPAPWLNLPKLTKFCHDIVNSFDTISTKEELRSILWSWANYVNCLYRWFFTVFPWELGRQFPRIEQSYAQGLKILADDVLG